MADIRSSANDPRQNAGPAEIAIPKELRGAWDKLVAPTRRAPSSPSPPPTTPDAGRGEQFEIIRVLGVVDGVRYHEAWDRVARLQVGIRELVDGGRPNPAAAEDFWHRARSQARQRHTNLLAVYSLAPERGWVITELCRTSMADVIVETRLSSESVKGLLVSILAGLDHLHRRGQVHGDVRPGAILLDNEGVVKLDLASGRDAGAELTLRPGQERYTSPETLDEQRFGRVTVAVDLYALGITMLELMAGNKFTDYFADAGLDVHGGGDAWLRWHMSATARLAPVEQLFPELPTPVAAVIERMLAKHVDDRWPSAGAALEALTTGALVPVALGENMRDPSVSAGVSLPAAAARSETSLAVRAIEHPALSPYERPRRLECGSALQIPGSPRVQRWVDRVTDKKNANSIAVALLLVAAFIAGLSALAPGSHDSEHAEKELAFEDRPPRATPEPEPSPAGADTAPPITDRDPDQDSDREPSHPADDWRRYGEAPVTPSPPASSPGPARLVLVVEPAEAWVKIDGEAIVGSLPKVIELAPGPHVITAGKWDYHQGLQHVEAAPGESRAVVLKLEPRPPAPSYDPILVGSSPFSREADEILKDLLEEALSSGVSASDQADVEYAIRRKFPQMHAADPRVAHALAAAAFDRGSYRHAIRLYGLSARYSPLSYSWPHKGLIRSLLAANRIDDALDALEQFVIDSADRGASSGFSAEDAFLADAAAFAGHVIALAEISRGAPAAALLTTRQITGAMAPPVRRAFDSARAELLARFDELGYDRGSDWETLTSQCLGDCTARERRALQASIVARQRLTAGKAVPWHIELAGRPAASSGFAAGVPLVHAAGF